MRDTLIGVEHLNVETKYTSVNDLKALKEEVTALRLRNKLLSQIWDAVKSLNLDYYRELLDDKMLMNPLTDQQRKLQTKVFEVIPESLISWHIENVVKYQNNPNEKDPEFW